MNNQENKKIKITMLLLIVAAILTAISAFMSLWRIDLAAPQYPEGLVLFIGGFDGVSGNLYGINELNHYVGMAKIIPSEFWEFQLLPYLLLGFAALFLVSAFVKKKGLSLFSLILFGIFGILSFVDFYYWTYTYGHNLDASAPIKVPGMAYQPPIFGYKKLLNFEAFSQPDLGGYLLIAAGLILAFAVLYRFDFFGLCKKKSV